MTTRDAYVAKLKEQLDRWNADIARWEEKAKAAGADVKERYTRELKVLEAQRELARYNLTLLESASASAWADLRKGADEAWERMSQATVSAAAWFGEKKGK
jgi:hypothetical protein